MRAVSPFKGSSEGSLDERLTDKCSTYVYTQINNFEGFKIKFNLSKNFQERVRIKRKNFYDKQATLCQKTWRGYFSRKYIFNYYKRKAYLLAIQHKNEAVLNELKEYKDYMDRQAEEKRNIEKYQKLEEKAKREHYLISTKQISGVYNSPYKP